MIIFTSILNRIPMFKSILRSFGVLAILSLIPLAAAHAEFKGEAQDGLIHLSLPNSQWAIEMPAMESAYSLTKDQDFRYHFETSIDYELLDFETKGSMATSLGFPISKTYFYSTAFRSRLPVTPEKCLKYFPHTGATTEDNHPWRLIQPSANGEPLRMVRDLLETDPTSSEENPLQLGWLTAQDGMCIAVLTAVKKDPALSIGQSWDLYFSKTHLIPIYTRSVNDYLQYAELYGQEWLFKALVKIKKGELVDGKGRTELLLKISDVYLKKGQFRAMERILKKIPPDDPAYIQSLLGLGLANTLSGRFKVGDRLLKIGFEKLRGDFSDSELMGKLTSQYFNQDFIQEFNRDILAENSSKILPNSHSWDNPLPSWFDWLNSYDYIFTETSVRNHVKEGGKASEPYPESTEHTPSVTLDLIGTDRFWGNPGYLVVHTTGRDKNHGWRLIGPEGKPLTVDFGAIESYDNKNNLIFGRVEGESEQTKPQSYAFDGKPLFGSLGYKVMSFFDANGIALAQDNEGLFFHIDLNGKPLYPERYLATKNIDNVPYGETDQGNWYEIKLDKKIDINQ